MKKSSIIPRTLPIKSIKPPHPPAIGDEVFTTGVFYWNVSGILDWLRLQSSGGAAEHEVIPVPVDIWKPSHAADHSDHDAYAAAADITRPVLLAEIVPDYRVYRPEIRFDDWLSRGYQLIDGYHRVEKARSLGLLTLPAIILKMEEHIDFMYKGYESYALYWNGKLSER